ncbi:MAG: hypothetical protein AVDCRST_MAG05-3610 [uncultured Rubrobacteraceae bacterium]|uniref:Uncharacterized protein n=1 Tax=uncultured Rubrobacteraceae bacterium TaxID=349277 RepID=A0A6J4TE98_9ACTN|nr:MAG: hypothetical protein AVDCRST_MAG05-3610 [uncultured Rubrobacteraceae bacterium]
MRERGEVRREVDRLRDERLRLDPGERDARETRKLEAAGWERRGEGPKAIWRRTRGDRWIAHHLALHELRRERPDAGEGSAEAPGEGRKGAT